MQKLPKIRSCFGVIIEDNQVPPRIYLVHNNPDPLGPNGEEGKPEGWGLPGGGNKDENEKPEETVRREVLGEAGLLTRIATRGNTEFGEILFESKPQINNDILIFHLEKLESNDGFRNIEETGETRRVMLADLGSILKMPLAVKIIRLPDGEQIKIRNPEGIYFTTRERIFGLLHYLGYDFYNLIPDLDKLIGEISREEVGSYVYDLLTSMVEERQEVRERRAKLLRPDLEDPYELQGMVERYQPLIAMGGVACQK